MMQKRMVVKLTLIVALLISSAFSGKLKVSGTKILNDKGETVVLQGVNMSGLEWHFKPWFGSVTINHIATVWKANVIRFPLNAQWYINNENANEKPYRTSVKEAVDFCAKYGMWAILDLHWQDNNVKQDAINDAVAKNFWGKVATDFKTTDNVLYDLYNEPLGSDWNGWKTRAESYINTIKAIDPTAIYIVGGMDWGYDLSQAANNMISPSVSTNVIYSSHHYPWKSNSFPAPGYSAIIQKAPVFLGEFGWCNDGCQPCAGGGSQSFVSGLLSYVKTNVSYAAWNFDTSGCPFMLRSNRTPFTRNSFGDMVYNDLSKKSLVRYVAGATTKPVAKITVSPSSEGPIPFTVTFDGSGSTGTNLTYKWDLGNGSTSTVAKPSATYTTEKTYTVKLTVKSGTDSSVATTTIKAVDPSKMPLIISKGKPVVASSIQSSSDVTPSEVAATNVNDGITTTRWSSAFSVPQWIQIDLGNTATKVNYVKLIWEASYATAYKIEISNNGGESGTWTTLANITNGDGGTDSIAVSGTGRYIRMYASAKNSQYGVSLYEFQVGQYPTSVIMNDRVPLSRSLYGIHRRGEFVYANLPTNGSEWGYSLSTISGRVIQKSQVNANGLTQFKLPSNLSKGTYIVQMESRTDGEQINSMFIQN